MVIEAGELEDYATAARTLGLTRARLTQLTNMLLLSPELQHRILVGETDASGRSASLLSSAGASRPDRGRAQLERRDHLR